MPSPDTFIGYRAHPLVSNPGDIRQYSAPHHYRIISSEVDKLLVDSASKIILDVGGYKHPALTQNLFPGLERFSLNIPSTEKITGNPDVIYDGINFPFADETIPAVIAFDVLEHVSPIDRQTFIEELVRISQKGIVISFPVDSEANKKHEEVLIEGRERVGLPHASIDQHQIMGLPTREFIETIGKDTGLPYQLFPATNASVAFSCLQEQ